MSSAQYRPLDSGVGARPVQSSVLRSAHGTKVRALWPKTANSRRVFVCVMILMMFLVYVVWCAVANYTDDGRGGSYATTTGKLLQQQQSTSYSTSPRSKVKTNSDNDHHYSYIVAMAAPLMLQKLKQQKQVDEINDFLNSSLIGLDITATTPTLSSNNVSVSARDMQRLPNYICENKNDAVRWS